MTPKRVLTCAALAVLIATAGLSGCGRRGDLEPSPDAAADAKKGFDSSKNAPPVSAVGANPGAPRARGIIKPKDPFLLDPLL